MFTDFENSILWRVSDQPVEYNQAVLEMETYAAEVIAGRKPELIWFLEHPHVYTVGTSGQASDVLRKRCPIIQTGRGGQVTYHGPGQRVVYLVLDLNKRGRDMRAYVRLLEEWIIRTLSDLGISGYRRQGRVGIWVPRNEVTDDKIAAIGVRVKKWVTMHGIAINVSPDLSFYADIIPCGIRDHGVTSLKTLGHNLSLDDLDKVLAKTFSSVFA